MAGDFVHLGPFSDWATQARRAHASPPRPRPGGKSVTWIRRELGFDSRPEEALDPRTEGSWEHDGVHGEQVSWSVGYGPRTHGWVLRPADASGPLPGVLALHCHGGVKYFGKEKIADGPTAPHPSVRRVRATLYEGRAYANELARRGFTVLVPDVFLWGSRRFPLDAMPDQVQAAADRAAHDEGLGEDECYDVAAGQHEHVVAKYCALLGVTLAGVVAYEDRVAATYLAARPDVDGPAIGCVGLSGGGCRSALLHATSDLVGAAVIAGMMSTYEALLDRHVACHTWMFLPPGLARHADWPDLAAVRAPSPLLVQYDRDDQLFPLDGMRAAHEQLSAHYASVGGPSAYRGEFHDGPHKFDLAMQESAFSWLEEHL